MKRVITDDGSVTLRNPEYDECYHSKSGALEESELKYIKPCKITKNSKVLDIGFGLGYNAAAALEVGAEVISLEKDPKALKATQKLSIPLKSYKIIQSVASGKPHERLKIIIGDAVNTIKTITEKFDAIFLDPFSPPKNPELWTESFFRDIKKLMKPKAILATYSCARITRDNLKNTGFIVKDGPIIGRRSPSTLAYLV